MPWYASFGIWTRLYTSEFIKKKFSSLMGKWTKRKCLSTLHLQKESVFTLHKRNHLLSEADYIFFLHKRDREPFKKVSHLKATNLRSKDLNMIGSKAWFLELTTKSIWEKQKSFLAYKHKAKHCVSYHKDFSNNHFNDSLYDLFIGPSLLKILIATTWSLLIIEIR